MKPRYKLTGCRYYHTLDEDRIGRVVMFDDIRRRRVLVWCIGKWAYELELEKPDTR